MTGVSVELHKDGPPNFEDSAAKKIVTESDYWEARTKESDFDFFGEKINNPAFAVALKLSPSKLNQLRQAVHQATLDWQKEIEIAKPNLHSMKVF